VALRKVAARIQGDVYQGLFFWMQAADLLNPGSMVERVILEHDKADGVDDIAVFYRDPGVDAGGWKVSADFYQVKYHVDNSHRYTSQAIIDPSFIRAKSSLLQRFYNAYSKLSSEQSSFRLHFASNWSWAEDDKLAPYIREFDGELPEKFYSAGDGAALGKIRESWRSHLDLDREAFEHFARTLRFQLDHFGRRYFEELVFSRLQRVGLRVPSADCIASPYDSLIQRFIMNSKNEFDAASLRELCESEGLIAEGCDPPGTLPLTIGVRSYLRFAERLESEVDELVCVVSRFAGRLPKTEGSWKEAELAVLNFLRNTDRRSRLRSEESIIALECHGSLALLAGWELSTNSGVSSAPIQKPARVVWRPTLQAATESLWDEHLIEMESEDNEVAVCLSVTHDITSDVTDYLATASDPRVRSLLVLQPKGGPATQSIRDADHAYQLASQLPGIFRSLRSSRRDEVHLFSSCPNALMFFIGQLRAALGKVTLYEFDFDMDGDCSYSPSILIPPRD